MFNRNIAGVGALLVAAIISASPARANCYEIVGCTDRDAFSERDLDGFACGILWEVRNRIYKERGYCFHTPRAIEAFGNAGCVYDRDADVPLNRVESANVAAIARVEARKACAR